MLWVPNSVYLFAGASYDSQAEFNKIALTKLEMGPKEIPILSILKRNEMEFLRTSGVVYNALMTKRYKSDSSLDVATFNMESWITRGSHFLPTWRNLLMILRNMGFKREATNIETYLKEMPHKTSQRQGSEVELGMTITVQV